VSELRLKHPRVALTLGMLFLALTLWAAATWPAKSQAYTVSVYCDGAALAPFSPCEGAERTAYAIEGWGEYAICVYAEHSSEFGRVCTSAGEHIYDPLGQTISIRPGITSQVTNHPSNTVHGRVYQP
jgi:hypothetical protein